MSNTITLERRDYKPFLSANPFDTERLERQHKLGLGNVKRYVEPEMLDTLYERKQAADKIAQKFSCVSIPHADGHQLRPWDDFIVNAGKAYPIFSNETRGTSFHQVNQPDTFNCDKANINELTARHYGCTEEDWTKVPPIWAAVVFPLKPTDKTKIGIRNSNKEMYEDKSNPAWPSLRIPIWVAALPEMPTTVLELAERVRTISKDAEFMLIFQPKWEEDVEVRNLLDPILLAWQPTTDYRNDGIWFKVAEWNMEPGSFDLTEIS